MTWSTPIEVSNGKGVRGPWRQNESNYDYVDDPSVALDREGHALVVWVDQRRKDVLFQAFDRGGAPRFGKAIDVSRSPTTFSWLPRIIVSNTNPRAVFVAWQEIVFSGGSHGGEIFFARSADGGASFSAPVNLSNSVAGDGKGRITKDIWHNGSLDLAAGPDGALYVAWTEYEGVLWLSRSKNGGASFSKPLRVAGGGSAHPARGPSLAVANDNTLYLSWTVGDGFNGSLQGFLMRKLAVDGAGDIAIVNSTFREGAHSRVRLVRGVASNR